MKKLGFSLFVLGLLALVWAGTSDQYVATQDNLELGTYLTDLEGNSLYIFTQDQPGAGISACLADCATIWPPYLVDSVEITLQEGFLGELGTITRDDGTLQLTYNGQPLYAYAADIAAGDVNGQGASGVWFLASYGEAPADEVADEMSTIEMAPSDEMPTIEMAPSEPADEVEPLY